MLATSPHRNPRALVAVVCLAALWASGCNSSDPAAPSASQPPVAPTLDQVRNATIKGIYDNPVTLRGGVYEGAPFVEGGASRPRVEIIRDLVVFGNLDGAPGDEAAAMLSESSGGTGEMIYLSVIAMRDGVPISLGTLEIGDRTKIRSFGISKADVVMDVVEAGPDDPMCCPTQLARRTYGIEYGTLKIKNAEVTGTLSIALLAGPEWTAVEIDGTPLPDGVPPPTAAFEGEGIAGFGGCNRYTGTIREPSPGIVAIGPLAGTQMACPGPQMEVEDRFLASLGKATQYTFLARRLMLEGMDGDRMRSVLLTRP